MIAWFLLITSGSGLLLIFLRRFRMTQRDLLFQESLQKEDAMEKAGDFLEDFPIENGSGVAPALDGGVHKSYAHAELLLSRTSAGEGDLKEVEELLLAIIANEPNHIDAHHKLGLLYLRTGHFSGAELYFSKLVNFKQDPVYFSNLGAALYQQQRLVEAAEAYENAIALDDRRAERLKSLAQVYFELGVDEKALHYFERASRRKPKDSELKLILADYYERLGRKEESRIKLKEILEQDPYNEDLKARFEAL